MNLKSMHISAPGYVVHYREPSVSRAAAATENSNQLPGEADAAGVGEKGSPSSVVSIGSADTHLSSDEVRMVRQLQARDREVRAHEQAHLAAAGALASGGATFTYQLGPNGQRYAIGGEVNVSTTISASDPISKLKKAQQLQRAALAPVDPSPQDRAVAQSAAAMAQQARVEIVAKALQSKELEKASDQSLDGAAPSADHPQERPVQADDSPRATSALNAQGLKVAPGCGLCGSADHVDGVHAAMNTRRLNLAFGAVSISGNSTGIQISV